MYNIGKLHDKDSINHCYYHYHPHSHHHNPNSDINNQHLFKMNPDLVCLGCQTNYQPLTFNKASLFLQNAQGTNKFSV